MPTLREQALGSLSDCYQDFEFPECQNDFPRAAPGWVWLLNGRSGRHEVWCNGSGLYSGTLEQMAQRTWELFEKRSHLTREWYEKASAALEGQTPSGHQVVSEEWLRDGRESLRELAWSIGQMIPALQKDPEEIPVILGEIQKATLEIKDSFVRQLGEEAD